MAIWFIVNLKIITRASQQFSVWYQVIQCVVKNDCYCYFLFNLDFGCGKESLCELAGVDASSLSLHVHREPMTQYWSVVLSDFYKLCSFIAIVVNTLHVLSTQKRLLTW